MEFIAVNTAVAMAELRGATARSADRNQPRAGSLAGYARSAAASLSA